MERGMWRPVMCVLLLSGAARAAVTASHDTLCPTVRSLLLENGVAESALSSSGEFWDELQLFRWYHGAPYQKSITKDRQSAALHSRDPGGSLGRLLSGTPQPQFFPSLSTTAGLIVVTTQWSLMCLGGGTAAEQSP